MNRTLTALFAAFEAALVAGIGVAIPLAPLTVLWGAQYGFAPDWAIFWRASADAWLVGHGVDLAVTLDAATAKSAGFPGVTTPFDVGMAALGFALLTVLLAVRAGRRIGEAGHRVAGSIVALLVFALLAFGVTASARFPLVQPSLVQGTLLPTLVFAIGLALGLLRAHGASDAVPDRIGHWMADWRESTRATLSVVLRGGAATAAIVTAIAAILVAVLFIGNYARIITLYEGLHGEGLGGFAITLGQLAFLPNLVVWAASWLVGPGFSIGAGSSVTPIATALGPIPALPVLGALPQGDSPFGLAGLLVPVIAGFLVGAVFRGRLVGTQGIVGRRQVLLAGAGIGVVGGAVLGILAAASAGGVGPGRLQVVGPDGWQIALWAAVEIAVAALFGMLVASRQPQPRAEPGEAATQPVRRLG
ncbi:MAG: hypothetical protein JWR53_2071 [Glaciihabitans sp.]|nr:hypothetical protein [Glaciihabitans sp.]